MRETILEYAREHYGTIPEYLWQRTPNYAVLRRSDNKKWYAAVLDIAPGVLGLPGTGIIDILDIKCDTALQGALLREPGFFPGYHMNKEHWITVLLDGSVPLEKVLLLLDMSYELAGSKKKRGGNP